MCVCAANDQVLGYACVVVKSVCETEFIGQSGFIFLLRVYLV